MMKTKGHSSGYFPFHINQYVRMIDCDKDCKLAQISVHLYYKNLMLDNEVPGEEEYITAWIPQNLHGRDLQLTHRILLSRDFDSWYLRQKFQE